MTRWHDVSQVCWSAAASGSLEEQWRQECLAFARVRKLKHVADMRIFYVVRLALLALLVLQPLTQGTKLLTDRLLAHNSGVIVNCLHEEKIPEGRQSSSVMCLHGRCVVFTENKTTGVVWNAGCGCSGQGWRPCGGGSGRALQEPGAHQGGSAPACGQCEPFARVQAISCRVHAEICCLQGSCDRGKRDNSV